MSMSMGRQMRDGVKTGKTAKKGGSARQYSQGKVRGGEETGQ